MNKRLIRAFGLAVSFRVISCYESQLNISEPADIISKAANEPIISIRNRLFWNAHIGERFFIISVSPFLTALIFIANNDLNLLYKLIGKNHNSVVPLRRNGEPSD